MKTTPIVSKSIAAISFVILIAGAYAAEASGTGTTTNPDGPKAHWAYSGSEGPDKWGDLSTAYALCKTGQQQSPIDISNPQQAKLTALDASYHGVPLIILNNGHTIQVNYAPGSTLNVGLSKYDWLQFHFHTPSENHVDGQPYPMEMHFVHKDANGRLGVLGVFFKSVAKNIALQEIWNHMPKSAGDAQQISDVAINGHDLLPENHDYYRFDGSLTTPPCSEGVQWHVMKEPNEASPEQISAFIRIIGKNARPV